MRRCVINGRRYTVSYVFNMVGNYYFNRKGFDFLVDAGDVSQWVEDAELKFDNGIDAAIEYAKDIDTLGDGGFWWKVKEA